VFGTPQMVSYLGMYFVVLLSVLTGMRGRPTWHAEVPSDKSACICHCNQVCAKPRPLVLAVKGCV
jgi:hypothetical protein